MNSFYYFVTETNLLKKTLFIDYNNKSYEKKVAQHNATVELSFQRAKEGQFINLTDLMIGKEKLIQESYNLNNKKKH